LQEREARRYETILLISPNGRFQNYPKTTLFLDLHEYFHGSAA